VGDAAATGRVFVFEHYAQAIVGFVRDHQVWAAPIVGALTFCESLAFLSLLIPAWSVLVAMGVLIAASDIAFWPVWVAGAVGAALGDWLSYWLGWKFKEPIAHVWPLSRYPDFLPRAHRFVERWGVAAIFIGRFSGPLRASVPLLAGILEMRQLWFQLANFASAFLWAWILLVLGDIGQKAFTWLRPIVAGMF
jgi:membrane protein DedA with SNARE-associated domain